MKHASVILLLNLLAVGPSYAQAKGQGAFDVEARRSALAQPALANARAACLAIPRDPSWSGLKPIEGLKTADASGTDGASNVYAWAVMVLTGRTLAGDTASEVSLRELLLSWAKAKAFDKTEVESDAYYALKRVLLPTTIAYSVLQRNLDEGQRRSISDWIDPLVRKIDWTFGGVIDHNNHRHLADSVLMAWGAIIGDDILLCEGL